VSWRVRGGVIPLDRPVIVGIINVTPDSFSDGGNFFSPAAAISQVERLLADGADIIDVGGESTRPGAAGVPEAEEWRRVEPTIRAVHERWPAVPISVDTVKAGVAAAALDAGAAIVNDVSGLRADPAMAGICADHGAGLIIMHSRGTVADMATYVHADYGADVTAIVVDELQRQIEVALAAGIDPRAIVIDPGIGFAKRSTHSLTVLAELPRVAALGYPILVGVSRKRFIGEITRVTRPADRTDGSIGVNVAALARGARLFRVHEAGAARHALDAAWAVLGPPEYRRPPRPPDLA
jgi:dihydropteroate synthase